MVSHVENSLIEKEYNMYLDSDHCNKIGEGFRFIIDPPIQTFNNQTAKLFVRDFSCLNSVLNVTGSDQDRTICIYVRNNGLPGNSPNEKSHTFTPSRFMNGKHFADELNSIFNDPTSSKYIQTEFFWNKHTSKMEFLYVQTHNVYSVYFKNTKIFQDFLNFDEYLRPDGEIVANLKGESLNIIDFNRNQHHLYITSDQTIDDIRHSAKNISGKIVKMPSSFKFGHYITFKAQEPTHKSLLKRKLVNHITLKLFDDGGQSFDYVDRFTCTLCILIYKPKLKIELPELQEKNPDPFLRP